MRVALLHDDALIHEQHAVADLARKAHLVGDDHAGHVVLRQRLDNLEHLADHLRVEGAGRLVKEHDLRLHRQRAHDGKALLLAAGEAGGLVVALIGEADAREQRFRLDHGLVLAHFAEQDGREGDVVDDGHMREDVEMLEDHAHLLAVLVDVDALIRDIHAVKPDVATGRLFEPVQAAQEGRFAGAGRADQGDDLALVDGFGNAV